MSPSGLAELGPEVFEHNQEPGPLGCSCASCQVEPVTGMCVNWIVQIVG